MVKYDSQKAASRKWDRENMAVLACRVTKETAAKFKQICAKQNLTVNAALLQHVRSVIEEAQE